MPVAKAIEPINTEDLSKNFIKTTQTPIEEVAAIGETISETKIEETVVVEKTIVEKSIVGVAEPITTEDLSKYFIRTTQTPVLVEEVAGVEEPVIELKPFVSHPLMAADIENTTEFYNGGITGIEIEEKTPNKITVTLASWFEKTFFKLWS